MNLLEKRKIEDVYDFEECASEIFERFLTGFTKENGLIRDLYEDDPFDEEDGICFMYTNKGTRLARRMLDRLHKIGEYYFPGERIKISSYLFVEP